MALRRAVKTSWPWAAQEPFRMAQEPLSGRRAVGERLPAAPRGEAHAAHEVLGSRGQSSPGRISGAALMSSI
jgi:hypothetical protein